MMASGPTLEKQIQDLLKQHKYTAAIRKLQQSLKREPNQTLTTTEADIRLLQGKHEFKQGQYAQAEATFQQVLELGLADEAYYWLAKCFLAQDQAVKALELFQAAFDSQQLPKEMGGCYLKLLFINGKVDIVETLIQKQAKRFYAPQLHWAKGAIALHHDKPKDALSHFTKMGKPASPGDLMATWAIYAHQQAGSWPQAAKEIVKVWPQFGHRPFSLHPPEENLSIQALTLHQVANTQHKPLHYSPGKLTDLAKRNAAYAIEIVNLIQADDVHEAAHRLITAPDEITTEYPSLKALSRPILLAAGQQAREQNEFYCSVEFWSEAIDRTDNRAEFDPNLALNLYKAMDLAEEYGEANQLLQQLINWLQNTAKQKPQDWPASRLNPTLATLYCWQADCQLYTGQRRDAERSLQKAEKLAPDHTEVMGRRGLTLLGKDNERAIALLRKSLEAGIQSESVYTALLNGLEDDPAAVKEIRLKFGKRFGDVGVETEVELPDWVEALSFQNYNIMAQFVGNALRPTPPLQALQIFLDAATDEPSSSQKITLDLTQALPLWETLLAAHSLEEQVEIVKAIYLTVQQHAKRNKKGMAALQKDYLKKMAELLAQQVPGADIGYLVLQAISLPSPKQIDPIVTPLLNRATQPGLTLARAQLEIRQFGSNRALADLIENMLQKEPQNPLLLLAAATLHPRNSRQYDTLYDKGFEIARRLQDAEALQAFREEDWLEAQVLTRKVVGNDIDVLNDPSPIDMFDMIQRLAKEAFGGEVPPEVIAQMLAAEMSGGFMDDDDDSDFDAGADFEALFGKRSKRKSNRKKSSQKRIF